MTCSVAQLLCGVSYRLLGMLQMRSNTWPRLIHGGLQATHTCSIMGPVGILLLHSTCLAVTAAVTATNAGRCQEEQLPQDAACISHFWPSLSGHTIVGSASSVFVGLVDWHLQGCHCWVTNSMVKGAHE